MGIVDEQTRKLHEQVLGAIALHLMRADRELPRSVREAITDEVVGEFAVWLCSSPVRTSAAAALTEHEVDASSATGCAHHVERDCQEERARLMAIRLAALTGFDG